MNIIRKIRKSEILEEYYTKNKEKLNSRRIIGEIINEYCTKNKEK
jgi:hypothetical protein